MKIIKTRDYDHMSRQAANILSAQVILKPDSVLGLATGSSPIGIYQQLIRWKEKGDIDFSQVQTVNLDEYVGLSPDHPRAMPILCGKISSKRRGFARNRPTFPAV